MRISFTTADAPVRVLRTSMLYGPPASCGAQDIVTRTQAYTRKSNLLDYILLFIGCGLVIYGAIDFHIFTQQQCAELEAHTRRIQEETAKLKALNAENQSITAEEK